MKDVQNLPVPLAAVDAFLNSMLGGVPADEQSRAALALIDELKKARQVLTDGYNRKVLTVCNGRLGYVDPEDAARFLSGEIPRLTVYRGKKPTRAMGLFFKRPPKFFKGIKQCKTQKPSTASTSTGTSRKSAKPSASSTPKPTKN